MLGKIETRFQIRQIRTDCDGQNHQRNQNFVVIFAEIIHYLVEVGEIRLLDFRFRKDVADDDVNSAHQQHIQKRAEQKFAFAAQVFPNRAAGTDKKRFERQKKSAVNVQQTVRNFVQPFVQSEPMRRRFLPELITKLAVENIFSVQAGLHKLFC